ncbi:bifunctional chorismate mutase/prephenate dehydratase [Glycocaulis sp.]
MSEGENGRAQDRAALRAAIDKADASLVQMLVERRRLAEALGTLKADDGALVRDVERERAVLERAVSAGREAGLDEAFVEKLFQLVIDDSLRRQRASLDARVRTATLNEAKVAYLGGPGSYSQFAADAHFAGRYSAVMPVIQRDFSGIFQAVERGEADYGFAPIENTTTGGIVEVYDLLRDTKLKIAGEHHYRVEHCIVGKAHDLGTVRTVLGHPQALRQSQRFFARHPELVTRAVSSSTEALNEALTGKPDVAAVAGRDAARLFGLNVIDDSASDHPENYTRFVALAIDPAPASPLLPCKTSLVLITSDSSGSLVSALDGFRKEGVNLTKLESRPIAGKPWQQMFFLDLEGHEEHDNVARALEILRQHAVSVHSFGSYGSDRLAPASSARR